MQPPICELCGKKCFEDGELIYFKITAKDKEWYELAKQPGFAGHPPNAAWFCIEHQLAAANLQNQPLSQAVIALRKSMDEGKIGTDLIKRLKDFLLTEEEE